MASLTDAMAMGPDNGGHRLGTDVPHLLVRRIACTAGEVEVEVDYQPRPEYGLVVPLLGPVAGGVTARGGAEWLVLSADGLVVDGPRAHGRRTLRTGEQVHFGLHRSTLEETPARVWSQGELSAALDGTVEAWRSWSALHQAYEGPWADLVHHSGVVLQALSFQPSGAIVAAATTSLPEGVGGERNWDYRYSWVRDSSFTMEALWVAACPDEADDFFAFMTTAAASSVGPGRGLQIMFGIGGEHDLSERELGHLEGIDAVDQRLTDDRGLVYRYRTEGGVDGLAGEEGTFLLCTFWLAQALALSGQVGRAREVFQRAAGFVNDVGLLAEEVDADTGELLGNFPQAFSHIGLVNAAWAISEAERRASGAA